MNNLTNSVALIVAAIISAIPPTLVAMATLIVSMRNTKKIREVHDATNSMKDELVAVTKIASRAEGHAAGVIEGRAVEKEKNKT